MPSLTVRAAMVGLALLAAVPAPALAHRTGAAVVESETEPIERATGGIELVAHHYFPEGVDMMFQRREGPQYLDGEVVTGTRDYAFVGGDAKNATAFGAMHVFDVTDPTLPVHLADIPCSGYHADAIVWEDLFFQAIDSAGTNQGCAEADVWDPDGLDQPGAQGLRVFDVSDPARPVVRGFIEIPTGVHNATVVPDAGLLYLAEDPFYVVDLTDPSFPVERIAMSELDGGLGAEGCHDIGLSVVDDLAFCAARNMTLIWDISDPTMPRYVSHIENEIMANDGLHHGARLAPDGRTLVLNDEFLGALDQDVPDDAGTDAGVGSNACLGPASGDVLGAVWFYDISDVTAPTLLGSFTPDFPDPTSSPCTSHFYNFVAGQNLAVVGWYEAGTVVIDFTDPANPVEAGVFLPELGNFWSAYWHRGYLYGLSRTIEDKGFGGGLWVMRMPGTEEPLEPYQSDIGTVVAPWSGEPTLQAAEPARPAPPTRPDPAPSGSELPTTGGGIVFAALAVLGVFAAAPRGQRRRRSARSNHSCVVSDSESRSRRSSLPWKRSANSSNGERAENSPAP